MRSRSTGYSWVSEKERILIQKLYYIKREADPSSENMYINNVRLAVGYF